MRWTDPTGLFVPLAASACTAIAEAVINTIGGALAVYVAFTGGCDAANDGVCRDNDDDPCELRRRKLEANRKAGESILRATHDRALHIRQYNIYAKDLNKEINMHNALCPKHRVEPLPLIPEGPSGLTP